MNCRVGSVTRFHFDYDTECRQRAAHEQKIAGAGVIERMRPVCKRHSRLNSLFMRADLLVYTANAAQHHCSACEPSVAGDPRLEATRHPLLAAQEGVLVPACVALPLFG